MVSFVDFFTPRRSIPSDDVGLDTKMVTHALPGGPTNKFRLKQLERGDVYVGHAGTLYSPFTDETYALGERGLTVGILPRDSEHHKKNLDK